MKLDAYFLNVDLKETRTGIEESAMKRTFYFYEALQLNPNFLTVRYNPKGLSIFNELKENRKIHKNTNLINLYRFYQDEEITIFEEDMSKGLIEDVKEHYQIENIKGTNDFRFLNEEGKVVLYNKVDPLGRILFSNHFIYNPSKEMNRRDYYDTFTKRISKTQHLENGLVKFEVYYTTSGRPCIYKTYKVVENKSVLYTIDLLNKNLHVIERFCSEEDFIEYWLKDYFNRLNHQIDHYLIVDRSAIFSKIIEKMKRDNLKTIFLMHSSHIVAGALPEIGKINKNYEHLLCNPEIADAIIIFTERQKQHIKERLGLSENLYVIPHNLEALPEKVSFNKRKKNSVVYLGRFSVIKNQKALIDAFEMVLKEIPDATLDLYGEGDTKNRDIKYLQGKNLHNNIKIHPFTSDVTSVYNNASLAAFPSKLEGFSLFILESISHGLPVVSFDINYGPSDMINDDDNGLLIPPLDVERLAEGLIKLLKKPVLLENMSKNAYETATKFTAEKISLLWRNVLNSI